MYFQGHHYKVILKIVAVICTTMFLTIFTGCLETPNSPDTSKQLEYLQVFSFQEGIEDSSQLKIHPGKSAYLLADAYPHQYSRELSFEWLRDSNVLGQGIKFTIDSTTPSKDIPNKLKATDIQGNFCFYEFNVVVNTAPQMGTATKPAQGDTLYGKETTAFFFQWSSSDKDLNRGDKIQHTLILDETAYPVGNLTNIYQAGFSEGRHSFSVIVTDSFGDSDTLKTVEFFVKNNREADP